MTLSYILNKQVNVGKDGGRVGHRLRRHAVLGFERQPCYLLARTEIQVSVAANFGSTSPFLQFLFEVPFQICLFSAKGKSTNTYDMPTNVEYGPGPWGEMRKWMGQSPCPPRAQASQVWTRKQPFTRHVGSTVQDMGAEEGLINTQGSIFGPQLPSGITSWVLWAYTTLLGDLL